MARTPIHLRGLALCAGWILMLGCWQARGQQPTNAPSATLPGQGLVSVRPILVYDSFDRDPAGLNRRTDQLTLRQELLVGLAPELAGSVQIAGISRDTDTVGTGSTQTNGVGDLRLGFLWRFYRNDFGPLDTFRSAASGTIRVPSGSDGFSTGSPSATLGINTTTILGRHGFNTSTSYTTTSGSTPLQLLPGDRLADHIAVAGAYLFRVAPRSFAKGRALGVYTQLEVLADFETDGDSEVRLGPGVLIEASRWATEFSVVLPVWQDLESRPERSIGIVLGVRLLL